MRLHNRDNFKTINDYFQEFKEICYGLVGIGFPIDNQQKVFDLLKGLGNNYESFVTSTIKPPIPSYNDTIQLLLSYENMKSLYVSTTNVHKHAIFIAQNKNDGNHYKNN